VINRRLTIIRPERRLKFELQICPDALEAPSNSSALWPSSTLWAGQPVSGLSLRWAAVGEIWIGGRPVVLIDRPDECARPRVAVQSIDQRQLAEGAKWARCAV